MNERLGETRLNNFGTEMKIIRYNNSEDIDIQFLDEYYYVYIIQHIAISKVVVLKIHMTSQYLVLGVWEMENILQEKMALIPFIIILGMTC